MALSASLGTAAVDQHFNHKIGIITPALLQKQFSVLCPSDIPEAIWQDSTRFSHIGFFFVPGYQCTF